MRNLPLGHVFLIVLILTLSSLSAEAQGTASPELGLAPDGSFQRYRVEAVNVASGNDVIRIPLFSLPQKGKLSLGFSLIANTNSWTASSLCTDFDAQCTFFYYSNTSPVFSPGEYPYSEGLGPQIYLDQGYAAAVNPVFTYSRTQGDLYSVVTYSLIDSTNAVHPLYYDATNPSQLRTADGSKLLFQSAQSQPYLHGFTNGTILDSQGTKYTSDGKIVDVNGNTIKLSNPGATNSIVDSVGRTFSYLVPPPMAADGNGAASTSTQGCPNLSAVGTFQPAVASSQWTIPGPNNTNVTYTFCYANIKVHTNFWQNGGNNYQTNTPPAGCGDPGAPACNYEQSFVEEVYTTAVIQSVVLPDKTYWGFIYDAADPNDPTAIAYGTIKKLIYPVGGSVDYTYESREACFWDSSLSQYAGNNVWSNLQLSKRTESDGRGNNYQWLYPAGTLTTNQTQKNVTDPNGNDTSYIFKPDVNSQSCGPGLETQHTVYQGGSGGGTTLQTVTTVLNFVPKPTVAPYYYQSGSGNTFPTSITTSPNNLPGFNTTTSYDNSFQAVFFSCGGTNVSQPVCSPGAAQTLSLGLPKTQSITDYSGSTLRTTSTSYKWEPTAAASYRNQNLLDTPSTVTISNSGGSQASQTTTSYDESAYMPGSGLIIGEPTSITDTGTGIAKHIAWTSSGSVDHTVDGNGVTDRRFVYGSEYSGLYPTSSSNALNQTTTYTYDFNTGKMQSITDPNSQVTTYTYDSGAHLIDIIRPEVSSGSSTHGETKYCYNFRSFDGTTNNSPTGCNNATANSVIATTTMSPSQSLIQETDADGLGRTIRTALSSDPSGADFTDTVYDGLDQITSITNPYRSQSDSTYGLTTHGYDTLGRLTSTQNPDQTGQSWTYLGNTSTFKDESSNQWQRTSDALGRLTKVLEPNGSSAAPSMETDYSYDANGNLLGVVQKGDGSGNRNRFFAYDSLSRLVASNNPENASAAAPANQSCAGLTGKWTTCYSYDGNGNLTSKTDNRAITTIYRYDNLNRLEHKFPADPNSTDPDVFLGYDGKDTNGSPITYLPITNAVGRLTETVTGLDAVTTDFYYSYDPMGRVSRKNWCIPANCSNHENNLQATYDLAGNLTSQTNGVSNPGILLTYGYDSANRLKSITSSWEDATHPPTLFSADSSSQSSTAYGPFGLQNARLGIDSSNVAKISLARTYDNRGRLVAEADAKGVVPIYSFSIPASVGFTPNGNLSQVKDSVIGQWSFPSYDTLSRLTGGTAITGSLQGYSGCWKYDSFGNRLSEAISTTRCAASPSPTTWATYNTNNQITGTNLMLSGYTYDASGNVVDDGVNEYAYDGDGHLCATRVRNSSTATQYIYDADGNRIAKASVSQTGTLNCKVAGAPGLPISNHYVFGIDGKQLSELSYLSTNGSEQWLHTNVFANGKLLATYSGNDTYFSFNDWVGTKRAVAGMGGCLSKYQSLPFGTNLTATGNCSDVTEHHFTGKERDTESGLDNFEARYYASNMGRFMSPDWSFAPEDVPFADFNDPQSLNLYAYARNNPLSGGDPSGHTYTVCPPGGGQCTNIDDPTFEAEQKQDQANGVSFSHGSITDSNGVQQGTYSHDPDIAGNSASNIAGMAYIGAHQAMVTEFVKQDAYFAAGALGGAAIGAGVEAIQAARAARIAAAVAKLSMVKPLVSNAKLAEVVEELFQVTDKVPGGLGGGVRYEAMTGDLLSPAGHAQEAGDVINQLNNILKNPNAGLSSRDQAIAKEIIGDLQRALGGR